MILAILLQEGKGGGLSALGGTQAESAFGSSNPIRRATVVLAIMFFLLAGVLSFIRGGRRVRFGSGKAPPAEEATTESDVAGEPGPEAEGDSEAEDESEPEDAPKGAAEDGIGATKSDADKDAGSAADKAAQ
jgi:protein translocase SecG subunit